MKKFTFYKLAGIKEKINALRENPYRVSMGYALGIFLATTPFIGVKVFIAIFLTWIFRWSKAAAIIGVFHINFLTGPIFYSFSYFLGNTVTGTSSSVELTSAFTLDGLLALKSMGIGVFLSLLTGGVILGLPLALASYYYSYYLIKKKRSAESRPSASETGEPVYTVITGASCGLGRELAIACAGEKRNLLLVALPGRNLPLFCERLEKEFGIKAHAFETDLSKRESIENFIASMDGKYPVNFLINNAGIGGTVAFETSSPDYLESIMLLNMRATVLLTRLLLPELKRHPGAHILNVSSMAAFSPLPFKTVYPATKAFISSFSRSLNQELKGTNVCVSIVHPGPMTTNADVTRRILLQGSSGKAGLLMASEVARISLKAIRKGREMIIPGFMNRFSLLLMRVVPYVIRMRILLPVFRKEITMQESLIV